MVISSWAKRTLIWQAMVLTILAALMLAYGLVGSTRYNYLSWVFGYATLTVFGVAAAREQKLLTLGLSLILFSLISTAVYFLWNSLPR